MTVTMVDAPMPSPVKRWKMPLKLEEITPSALEVNFPISTKLYDAITDCDWDGAISAVTTNPEEARTWVVRHFNDDDDDLDSLGNREAPDIMWRFLPIHSACARQPPLAVIAALLKAYPDGAKCVDDQGMYALHYACGNQASREVIRTLLQSFSDAARLTDHNGMLPIHYLACWGPSTVSVIDMVLVAHRDVATAKDADGKTPLELAAASKYPNNLAVVEALKRWLGDGITVNDSNAEVTVQPEKEDVTEDAVDEVPEDPAEDEDIEDANENEAKPEVVDVTSPVETLLPNMSDEAAPEDDDISDSPSTYSVSSAKSKRNIVPIMPGDMMDEVLIKKRSVRRGRSRTRGAVKSFESSKTAETTASSRSYRSSRTSDVTNRSVGGSRSYRAARSSVDLPDLSPRMRRHHDAVDEAEDALSVASRASQFRPYHREQLRIDMPYYDIDHEADEPDEIENSGRTERTFGRVLYCPVTPKPVKSVSCSTMTVEPMYSPRTINLLRDEIEGLKGESLEATVAWETRLADKDEDHRAMMGIMEAKIRAAAERQEESDRRIARLVSGIEERDAKLESNSQTIDGMAERLRGMEQERDDLRQTLTDLSEAHDEYKSRAKLMADRLGAVNATLETLMEEQKRVIVATEVRSLLMAELWENRQGLVKELLRLEESARLEPALEAKSCLTKQMSEMEALSADIAAVLEG